MFYKLEETFSKSILLYILYLNTENKINKTVKVALNETITANFKFNCIMLVNYNFNIWQ